LNGGDQVSSLSGLTVTGRRLNARGTLDLLDRASMVLNGDVNGNPTNDTLLIQLDPSDSNYVEAYRNSARQARVLKSSLTRIDVNGLGGDDTITVDINVKIPVHVFGGFGNDILIGGGGGDVIHGGPGTDRADYSNHDTRGISATVGSGVDDGYADADLSTPGNQPEGDDISAETEEVWGTGGPDTLTGREMNNVLVGRAGADTLSGSGGDDHLVGSDGNDTLFGGDGNDWLEGEAGADLLQGNSGHDALSGGSDAFNSIDIVDYADKGVGVQITLDANSNDGNGTDENGGVGGVGGPRDYVQSDIEEVRATAHDDTIDGTPRSADVRVLVFEGADVVVCGSGNDYLDGGADVDHLDGGDGNDIIYGRGGHDGLYGGKGDDTLYMRDSDDDTYHGGYSTLASSLWGNDSAQRDAAPNDEGDKTTIDTFLA
jgi:Ca2+-binding RTX toxin-like protein